MRLLFLRAGNSLRGLYLVIPEFSHPLRPVFGQGATGPCPGASRIEDATPLQCPQFLYTNLPNRPVHEKCIYSTIITVNTITIHKIIDGNHIFIFWRIAGGQLRTVRHPGIHKHRNTCGAHNITAAPRSRPTHAIRSVKAIIACIKYRNVKAIARNDP
jgi:hypothetical protein